VLFLIQHRFSCAVKIKVDFYGTYNSKQLQWQGSTALHAAQRGLAIHQQVNSISRGGTNIATGDDHNWWPRWGVV
jgi:hypothetical protein